MATANSPWEHPDPRGLPAVQGVLRVVVAIQCWGAAAELLQSTTPSDLSRLLFQGMSTGATEGVQFDRIVGVALLVCGLVTLEMQAGLDGFLAIEKHLLVKRGLFTSPRRRRPYSWDLDGETAAEVDRLFVRLRSAITAAH